MGDRLQVLRPADRLGARRAGGTLATARSTSSASSARRSTQAVSGSEPAKRYALDRVGEALQAVGHPRFLADLGGEYLARGRHASGRAWRVGVEVPRPPLPDLAAVLTLSGRAVGTSGTRANGHTLAGRRYSHIIVPAQGAPVAGGPSSVSVLAATAMEADACAR